MSTRQLLIEDLSHQPDSLVREVWHYLKFIELQNHKETQSPAQAETDTQAVSACTVEPIAYWKKRPLLPEYEALVRSGALSGGTDSTVIISEDRDAR